MKIIKFICKLNLIIFILHSIVMFTVAIIMAAIYGLWGKPPNYFIIWYTRYLLHFLSLGLWIVAYFKEIICYIKDEFYS